MRGDVLRSICFLFLILSLLPLLSCIEGRHFSRNVDVQMCADIRIVKDNEKDITNCVHSPVVHFQGQENIICRRGLPEPFITPWDAARRQQGDNAEGAQEQENRSNNVFISVNDYWFKVFPVIKNRNAFHLVITQINFRARAGEANNQITDKSFSSGYCETVPYLYILEPGVSAQNQGELECAIPNTVNDKKGVPQCLQGSYTSHSEFEQSYVMGNLAFYVDGLSAPPQRVNNNRFTTLRVPSYFVEWEVRGIFYSEDGRQVGSLQKTGAFQTQRSSF